MTIAPNPSNDATSARPLSQVVHQLKGWVERCGWVWVSGQIIELNRRTGLQFLTLRDLNEEISVRVHCSELVLNQAGPIATNTEVAALVHPMVWPKSGSLSFQCRQIEVVGSGRLLAQLEALKNKLSAEGLFQTIRKKKLPILPSGIGVITGANSAAEHDVMTNILNRWPQAPIKVEHTLVQGRQAAAQVIDALTRLDVDPSVDVIIIARGGGSLEDLLPFSDEGLVRAVSAAKTPVVSAIGHESDMPLIDYAADVRASTPTAAAKIVVPVAQDELADIETHRARLRQAIARKIQLARQDLATWASRPVLKDPSTTLKIHAEKVTQLDGRLNHAMRIQFKTHRQWVENSLARVRAMSPKATLERGYAIVADSQKQSVTSVRDVDPGDQIQIYLSDGQLYAEINYGDSHE